MHRDAGAILLERIADVGREAPVSQRAMEQHPEIEAEPSVPPSDPEQRVSCVMAPELNGRAERDRQAAQSKSLGIQSP